MSEFSATIQQADWKTEKHAPIIEAPETVQAGDLFPIRASLGKAIAHPNTAQHHIVWMGLYYLPTGAKQTIELAHADFSAHAASVTETPDPALTQPFMEARVQLAKSGTLQAVAYCNIHGVWQASKAIEVNPAPTVPPTA
ncbi:MAG: class II SORL domain-containing protein [Verrucomicrobiota bacterium]|jgi:superoxide reductase|nr:class II SORL domain-containing protein [Verrucomicrobiota bacterium]